MDDEVVQRVFQGGLDYFQQRPSTSSSSSSILQSLPLHLSFDRGYYFLVKSIQELREKNLVTVVIGSPSGSGKTRYEREVIQEIVEHIFRELKYLDFVGLDCVNNIGLDLGMELDEVSVIGIWVMLGIGKTSIAQVLSERICNIFEAGSFIVNVRQKSIEKGLFHIQKQLCQDLLKREVNIQNVNVISSRLRHKRVLIILDDVNELEQIEALAGKDVKELNDRFGGGSKIIITTTDERLLLNCGAKIHKVENLSENEARLLFYRKAFKKDQPKAQSMVLPSCSRFCRLC